MHTIKMRYVYAILILALFMQVAFLNRIRVFGAEPDIILSLVIFFALFFGARAGLVSGIFAGFLKDIFSSDIFGMNVFVIGMTGFTVGVLNTKFFKESKMTQALLVFVFTMLSELLHYMCLSLVFRYRYITLLDYIASSCILTSAYTALVAIPIFSKLVKVYNLQESEDLL